MWTSIITSIYQAARTAKPTRLLQIPRQYAVLRPPLRTFHFAPPLQTTKSQKEGELDRNVLNPERSEAVKTGTDSEVGADKNSYDPSRTTPDSELQQSAEASRRDSKLGDPLDVSGANKEISRTWDPTNGSARGIPKAEPSRKGLSKKKGVIKTGPK